MLGIDYAESEGFIDAVGDIAAARLGPFPSQEAAQADLDSRTAAGKQVPKPAVIKQETWNGVSGWWVVNPVWGPSLGKSQIRALRDPSSGNHADTFRDAKKLHDDPVYQAQAAWEISDHGKRFDLWSTFRNKTDLPFRGKDYTLRRGHPCAAEWSK